jgi:hypothetical protein
VAEPYLTELTRVELLRGYVEAIEEIKTDIDDAYKEKQDVREDWKSSLNSAIRRIRASADFSRDGNEREALRRPEPPLRKPWRPLRTR